MPPWVGKLFWTVLIVAVGAAAEALAAELVRRSRRRPEQK